MEAAHPPVPTADAFERNSFLPPRRRRIRRLLLGYKTICTTNWLEVMAELYGPRTAVVVDEPFGYPFLPGRTASYAQLQEFANRAGNALLNLGVQRGDRVVIVPSNRPELAFLNFAGWKIGAVPVPVNSMYTQPELRYIVENSGAKALITDRAVFETSIKDRADFPGLEHLLLLESPAPRGCLPLSELMAQAPAKLDPAERGSGREVVQIFYTSGTTGRPKGAMLSRLAIVTLLRFLLACSSFFPGPTPEALVVSSLPLAHIMGMWVMLIQLCGITPYYFLRRFEPKRVLDLMEGLQATACVGVPAMFTMLLNQGLEQRNLSAMRVWASAADKMPAENIQRLLRVGHRSRITPLFIEMYGQVETSGLGTIKLNLPGRKRSAGGIGLPLPWIKVRVVDEQGNPVPRGEVGEVVMKGSNVLTGYWGNEEATRNSFDGQWFRTGDLARQGRFGLFEFVDRKSDRIKVGGYSVFSAEVETELLAFCKLEEVAVIGIPDPVKGEVPLAVVTLKPGVTATAEEILAWAQNNIARFKCPRRVEILTDLPKGATLKTLKKELRQRYAPKDQP